MCTCPPACRDDAGPARRMAALAGAAARGGTAARRWRVSQVRTCCSGVAAWYAAHHAHSAVRCRPHDRQQGQDDQVPDRRHHQQRHHLHVALVDHLHGVKQFWKCQNIDDRGVLRQADQLVEHGRQDRPHGLRDDDPEHLPPPRQAQRGGRLQLPLIDGQNAAADDLRRKRRLVQAQPQRRGTELAEQIGGSPLGEHNVGERDAERDRAVEIAEIIENEQQHEQRN